MKKRQYLENKLREQKEKTLKKRKNSAKRSSIPDNKAN